MAVENSPLLAGLSDEERASVLEDFTPEERAALEGGEAADLAAGAGDGEAGAEGAAAAEPANQAAAGAVAKDPAAGKDPKEPDDEDDEEDAAPAAGKAAGRRVSYGKFQRTREKAEAAEARARQLEQEAADLREKFARGDERLRLLAEAMTPQDAKEAKKDEDPEPDPNTDLIGWAQWSRRQRERDRQEITQLRDGLGQTQQTITTRDEATTLRDNYQRDAVAFARETPDFGPAYNHLLQSRANQLAVLGCTEDQIRQTLFEEEQGIVLRARELKKRPAEMVYAMAKHFGWKPEMAQPAPNGGGNGAGGAAAAAAAGNGAGNGNGRGHGADAQPSVTDEIARIQAAQAASRSLSGTPGAGANGLTMEALVAMSNEEFETLYKSRGPEIDRVMAGRH